MCEFMSWIEKGKDVLFLTAKDINSSRGKKVFKDCKDNDFLGHNAIRTFYGLEDSVGYDEENKSFWNGKIPKQTL